MSDLRFDSDGFVDMEQFPDDGTDLGAAELDSLRTTLLSDPVEEPTDDEWEAMFDDVVTTDDDGPFSVDPVEGDTADIDATTDDDPVAADTDTADLDATDDTDATDDLVFHPGEDDATVDDLDLDDVDPDGGLDLGVPDDGIDDAYSPEALDDGPADIAGNDFEDLL